MLRRFLPIAAVAAAAPAALAAQSITDIGARLAPQYHSYSISDNSNTKISEFSLPIYVLVPITSNFNIDVGSAFANSRVEQTISGTKTTSTISGLTDTQIRGNLSLGTDFLVITGGVNLPTGKSTVPQNQLAAAGFIGSDFFSFPISSMGSGFGGTGGIAMAQAIGGDWNLGLGLSMRKSAQYDPFDAAVTGGTLAHYTPGNEYRARVGLDHPLGTGRFLVGVTYSTFGDDNLGGSVYNTGNRIISQLAINDNVGPGQVTLSSWDLFRASGKLPGNQTSGKENIANGQLSYAIPMGNAVIEPNVEGRVWTQDGLSASGMATFGLRLTLDLGGFMVMPGFGYSVGQLAAQDAATLTNIGNSFTGMHGVLAIRLR